MKIFQILNIFPLLQVLYSQYLQLMSESYQQAEQNLDLNTLLMQDRGVFAGFWSRYSPLGVIQQVGLVGLMDSNCFHHQSIIGKSSKGLEQIHYDCLYPESKTIQKIVTFNTQDGQQHVYKIEINPSEYENVWYLYGLLYYPQKGVSEFIIVKENQILLMKKVETFLFQENFIKLTIGGSLFVQNSNIKSIEVGKIIQIVDYPENLSHYQIEQGILLYVRFFDTVSDNICESVRNFKLSDQDLFWLDEKSYISNRLNTDSFILAGWFRITKIHQFDDEFTYQFLKMSKNTNSEQFSNPNLAPFQLFYKISPNNNKIIITTYSYNYPIVTLDFTNSDNSFIITEEFEINHKILLWHSLFVNLISDQIYIQIKFFDSYDVYEYSKLHAVKQFTNVKFLIQYGNLMKSVKNYLDIQTRNNIFYNCQQQIEQQNCHYSCQDCDGPTNTDCLSCSEESQRIYIPEHKACICPYHYLDDQIYQNCLSFSDLNFQITDLQEDNHCKFGYFQYDDSCYSCPSIISDKLTTCLDCLQNEKGWKERAICTTQVYVNPNGNTARRIIDQGEDFFIFDGLEPYFCRECHASQFSKIDTIYYLFSQLEKRKFFFCKQERYQEFHDLDVLICLLCHLLDCQICSIEMTGIKCSICLPNAPIIINGFCTSEYQDEQATYLKGCTTPQYLNSLRECKQCPIKNCKYCFEYKKNDLDQSTLHANFEIFEVDEYLTIGCALCENNFIFDFTIGKCIQKEPSLPYCIRSFINLQNQEICTLSQTDFSVALEIINCGSLIENCIQCVLTPWYEAKCIICKVGFTASIRRGNCYPNTSVNAIIVIDGDDEESDAWVQRVQSFIMKFLPNLYFYQRDYVFKFSQEGEIENQMAYEIECKEGYSQNEFSFCVKYCTQECLICYENKLVHQFYCAQCPLNQYFQPVSSQADGQCIRCPELCEVCEERSEDEIQKLNPYFQISDDNRIYSYKCIRPISNKNVVIDPYFQIAKYCFTSNCNQEFTFKFKLYTYEENNKDEIDIHYCNQIGLQFLNIQLETEYNITKIAELKSQIFSLQYLKIVFQNYDFFSEQVFSGFDSVEIIDLFLSIKVRMIHFKNQNQKVDFILNNLMIEQDEISNTNSVFDSELFGDITLNNISIINSNFTTSSLFNLNQNCNKELQKYRK